MREVHWEEQTGGQSHSHNKCWPVFMEHITESCVFDVYYSIQSSPQHSRLCFIIRQPCHKESAVWPHLQGVGGNVTS